MMTQRGPAGEFSVMSPVRGRAPQRYTLAVLAGGWFLVGCLSGESSEEPRQLTFAGPPAEQAAEPAKKAAHNTLTAEEIAAGWIKLFDGETLYGWKANNAVDWSVKDGVIGASQGEPGLLLTTTEFSHYELRCDFRLEKDGNSGVFLQTVFDPKDPTKDCYELNICDSHPAFPTGSLVGVQKPSKAVKGEEEWLTFHVTVKGASITVKLGDEEILKLNDERETKRTHGWIGLQKNAGKIEFRNIYLRPLELEPLFNGRDLTGWRTVPGGKSTFEVVDGAIHVVNGRGYLETEQTFTNFVLQAEIKSNGEHLNSGIFFRALPGTEEKPAEGYEAQVRNEWTGEDRTKPVDFGTGAIYRRQAARRVVSSDFEWFTMTLIPQGPHISVWVNGHLVTDWTDTRKPDPNPRNGLRLEAGHLSIQGHDPTTDLSFRNIRIRKSE